MASVTFLVPVLVQSILIGLTSNFLFLLKNNNNNCNIDEVFGLALFIGVQAACFLEKYFYITYPYLR